MGVSTKKAIQCLILKRKEISASVYISKHFSTLKWLLFSDERLPAMNFSMALSSSTFSYTNCSPITVGVKAVVI